MICSSEDKTTAGLFAMLVWTLWNNRNNRVWNETSEPGRSLGTKAQVLWGEWNSVQQLHNNNTHTAQQHLQHGASGTEQQQQQSDGRHQVMDGTNVMLTRDFIKRSIKLARDGVCVITWDVS
ncbi:unnamed protein product [Trifolium pratense]|uniref:Uncharacterized protein n=1 Tax=Trifolium pratense TaxID=57577 RepID=A0ACB0M4N0_TRIPR|nr:unnamed protein product [Trifolium pratense]